MSPLFAPPRRAPATRHKVLTHGARPLRHAPRREVSGFTLVELLVALAVTAILLAIAIPSFNRITQSNRLTTAANDLVNAIANGRMEAVKHNAIAQLCSNVDSENGSSGSSYATGCEDHPGAVYVFQGSLFTPVADAPSGIVAPIKYNGTLKALRFKPDGLAYATTSSTPYAGTVADICSSSVKTDNHRVISMAAGSIVRTVTTNGACP